MTAAMTPPLPAAAPPLPSALASASPARALGVPGRPAVLGVLGVVVHRPRLHRRRSGDRTTFPRGPGAEWRRPVALGSRERWLRLRFQPCHRHQDQTFLEQTKTRFNKNYKGMSLSKITTTVGLNIGTIDVGKTRLMFWDLGGQEELQSLWDKYYAESHGVIYVIDSTDEERLSESKRAFEKMITSEALEGVPILVLANKQDVETCLSIPDIKTAFSDCINKIGKRDCLTQACSALTGKGVNEGIEWMVKCVVRNIHRPPRKKDIT
uniref:ADP-ribosylation factor-related protein 1 n=1 Tax=Cyanistes caeruleus TaxID=156563 RepID=A0A8C0VI06_CYACU